VPEQLGVSQDVLDSHYLIQIALLDPACHAEVERQFILPNFDVALSARLPRIGDFRDIPGLEVQPPDVHRYFVRAKPDVLRAFAEENGLTSEGGHGEPPLQPREVEDEFVYRNSYRLNDAFYASLGEKKAFVLSHGRNLLILKLVGYAEQIVEYYRLENFCAHAWIAHQRYPTKGRVWHPGGAHPFIGLNEALVHNGDFANYHSVGEYLRQRNIRQQFQLLGITDTAMLRPQVFALSEGDVQIGLICSEKQAIDATLRSLAREDSRFCPIADRYWNARGGSSTDGGAFVFTVEEKCGRRVLACADKFGRPVVLDGGRVRCDLPQDVAPPSRPPAPAGGCTVLDAPASLSSPQAEGEAKRTPERPRHGIPTEDRRDEKGWAIREAVRRELQQGDSFALFRFAVDHVKSWTASELRGFCDAVRQGVDNASLKAAAIDALTLLHDRRYDLGDKRRASVCALLDETLKAIFESTPLLSQPAPSPCRYRRIDLATRGLLGAPQQGEEVLVVNAEGFPPEGEECDAVLLCNAHCLGWRSFIVYGYRGQRFTGCGFGPATQSVRIDVYGSSGDYLASGIDGMTIAVHGNGQDQLGQIMKRGKLVVYGDVGRRVRVRRRGLYGGGPSPSGVIEKPPCGMTIRPEPSCVTPGLSFAFAAAVAVALIGAAPSLPVCGARPTARQAQRPPRMPR